MRRFEAEDWFVLLIALLGLTSLGMGIVLVSSGDVVAGLIGAVSGAAMLVGVVLEFTYVRTRSVNH